MSDGEKKDVKKLTRARAERALSAGADPAPFMAHGNYHVRYKAWTKMGRPEDAEDPEMAAAIKGVRAKLAKEAAT